MCIHRVYMAKRLYWRLKINGKWTWRPVKSMEEIPLGSKWTTVYDTKEEEE